MDLQEKLKHIPNEPGVYLHKDKTDKIIYVGKAKVLKNRVKSYFNGQHWDPKTIELVKKIENTDWIVTHTEYEALLLEEQLIKKHLPKYNIRLKEEEQTYPYIRLSVQEMFPRLTLQRHYKNDGALYYGPYVNVFQARKALKAIRYQFPLRQKNLPLDGTKKYRPCLNYQLKRCMAPCAGFIDQEEYGKMVRSVQQFIQGNYEDLINSLKEQMLQKASELKFEEAGKIKSQIEAIQETFQKQRVVSSKKIHRDVFYIHRYSGFAGIQILFIRNGALLSSDFVFFKDGENYSNQELMRSTFSNMYVENKSLIPKEILIPEPYEEAELLENVLSEKANSRVYIKQPQRGELKSMMDMAEKNAATNMEIKLKEIHSNELILSEVKMRLYLDRLPHRVECFDISNISGVYSVGSMIVFENNAPFKKDYRSYHIKTVEGPDDFASMKEVLERRYKRALTGEQPLPDLIIIDGGKGQLNAAYEILRRIGIDFKKVDIIGLAKGRSKKRQVKEYTMEQQTESDFDFEYVVKPNRKDDILLRKNTSVLYFLQRIRDEAHRFAITMHRKLRSNRTLKSNLTNIPGIGEKKKKALLKTLKSMEKIKSATLEELEEVDGITGKDAQNIYDFFKS